MSLERYTELAQKILGNSDPEQKYRGLSNLINLVADTLPNDIIDDYHDLVLSNRTLRFNSYWSEVYCYHSGLGFLDSVLFLNRHRAEVEQWECDDEATIATRDAMLSKYAQHDYIKYSNGEVHPDNIYCQHGSYRKYHDLKDTYYYRLGRMIQTNYADNGNLKATMQMVCLYAALNNERSIVADELMLLGIEIPGTDNNKPMHYYNITDLRESAGGYKMLTKYDPDFILQSPEHYRIAEPIERLHNAIDELSYTDNGKLVIKTDEIRNVLDAYNPNQEHIAESLSNVIEVVTDLRDHVGKHMGALLRIDPGASNVFCFLNAIVPILETELQRVIERKKYAPTEDDEKAVKDNLIPFIEGKYGDMTFDDFMRVYVVNGISQVSVVRRLSHMIANCPEDKTKGLLIDYLDHHKLENDANAVEPITKHHTLTQIEPTPRHEPPQAAEATATDDPALPDYSRMNSYTPIKGFEFDMSALYEFLIAEGVIDGIDEDLLTNCITHAHMNVIWNVGKHHRLKCVFRHLKDHFPNDWIDVVAERMGTTRKKITAFDRAKIGDFEMRLRNII